MKIGVLAIQGGYEAHATVLRNLDITYCYVTRPDQLKTVQGLILPGGESTTMLNFLLQDQFLEAILRFNELGGSLFGTCAGAILLAKEVINPTQPSLQLIDVTLERNAYGRQLGSHIGVGHYLNDSNHMEMVFIRAPRITRVAKEATIFATFENQPVGLLQGNTMLTTFHPELTHDTRIHQLFIERCHTFS